MAVVRRLERITLDKDSAHTEVDGTFTIVESNGEKFLQIDTYGSKQRQIPGKKANQLDSQKRPLTS